MIIRKIKTKKSGDTMYSDLHDEFWILDGLDVEIGSTLTFCNEKKTVFSNMQNASDILYELKEFLGSNI